MSMQNLFMIRSSCHGMGRPSCRGAWKTGQMMVFQRKLRPGSDRGSLEIWSSGSRVVCAVRDLRESRFSSISFKFHFSSNFYFTFTSQSRFPVISISLSLPEKSEREKNFTLFLEKKECNLTPSLIKKN